MFTAMKHQYVPNFIISKVRCVNQTVKCYRNQNSGKTLHYTDLNPAAVLYFVQCCSLHNPRKTGT